MPVVGMLLFLRGFGIGRMLRRAAVDEEQACKHEQYDTAPNDY